tara:strand:- start:1126 stop:1566 length:441 start_codon:yes stop_codon:yes gene_type:complete
VKDDNDRSSFPGLVDLERENKELHRSQVREINERLRKVRTISKKSKQFVRQFLSDEVDRAERKTLPPAKVPGAPVNSGLYMESVGKIDDTRQRARRIDDTSRFLLPEPKAEDDLASVLIRALNVVHTERVRLGKSSSRVLHRWRIL